MAILEILLLFSLMITSLFLTAFLQSKSRREFPNLPPGRLRGLPFIGEALSVFKPHSCSTLGSYLDRNIQRYGKIFHTSILRQPTIISVDPEFNLFVMKNEGKLFLASPPKSMMEIAGRNSLLNVEVREQVLPVVLSFLNPVNVKTRLLPELDSMTVELLDSWKNRSASFSALDEAKKLAFNLVVKHTLNMEAGAPETEKLRKEYRTFMSGLYSLPINIPGTAYHRALKSRSIIAREVEKKLDQYMRREETNKEDTLISLVTQQKELSREVMLDFLVGFPFGGHDTVSSAITLTIYFLNSCPRAIQQLREEHQEIVDSKKVNGVMTNPRLNWDDYRRMQFTHNVVNETLRLGNVAKIVLYRRAIFDVQYKGFDIPCGWSVLPILSGGHLDDTIYENPQMFNPWRWERTGESASKKNFMPFGGGAKLCPGETLTRLEMALFIHHLVLRYDWELAEPDHPISFPFTDFPKGLPIKVRPLKINTFD